MQSLSVRSRRRCRHIHTNARDAIAGTNKSPSEAHRFILADCRRRFKHLDLYQILMSDRVQIYPFSYDDFFTTRVCARMEIL